MVATGAIVFVFYLCGDYFSGLPDAITVTAWVISLMMAFLIGFLLEALIGLIGFWFLEVSSLLFIYMMLNYFLSGHMIPLDWIGEEFLAAMQYSPFKFLAYMPATIMLGKYSHQELLFELTIGASWIVVLLIANRVVFRLGVKRYGAYGG